MTDEYVLDKEREIERLRIDVCELRSRFERDLAQKEIWFRDELDRRKNEYDRKIDELIRNQHEELEGIRHHCAEFNRDFENHMRCESDAKSNHVIAEMRQNMMCEFEKGINFAINSQFWPIYTLTLSYVHFLRL